MYQAYWQLKEKPFENTLDPRFYYPSESHQAALLKLRYAMENRGEAALVTGSSGMGKTLLVSMLRNLLGERFQPWVEVGFPQMPPQELLAYLADALEGTESDFHDAPLSRSIQRIGRLVAEAANEGRHPVIVLEDAHLITDPEKWEVLRLLLNFRAGMRSGLSVLLVAQTCLLPLLERMSAWEERLMVKSLVRPFSVMETAAYVSHRLKVAGNSQEVFEPKALECLHELAQGIPRRINRLADLALLVGYAEAQETIPAEQIQAVAEELLTPASQ